MTILATVIRPVWMELESLAQEKRSLQTNLRRYASYADATYIPPSPPSGAELEERDKRVPVNRNGPEVVVAFEEAASRAGVTIRSVERIGDPSKLPLRVSGEEESAAEEAAETKWRQALGVPADPALKATWYKLDADVPREKLASFMDELEKGERLVTVAGWDYVWGDAASPGTLAVYVIVWHYLDPGLNVGNPARLPPTGPEPAPAGVIVPFQY
ncbi:hypothetical protein [Staphylospora marina]|uniref:hypothetical protein n=1 Tax=Staphylospora marina TaxID=2490858 RepID=UPI000F5B94C1|nr:hypothetical protein [Staphylospora marina]